MAGAEWTKIMSQSACDLQMNPLNSLDLNGLQCLEPCLGLLIAFHYLAMLAKRVDEFQNSWAAHTFHMRPRFHGLLKVIHTRSRINAQLGAPQVHECHLQGPAKKCRETESSAKCIWHVHVQGPKRAPESSHVAFPGNYSYSMLSFGIETSAAVICRRSYSRAKQDEEKSLFEQRSSAARSRVARRWPKKTESLPMRLAQRHEITKLNHYASAWY